MNDLGPPEAPDHLLLATLPCVRRKVQPLWYELLIKISLSKHMLVVHEASRLKKILKDRYLVKL